MLRYYRDIARNKKGSLLNKVIWLADSEGGDLQFTAEDSISGCFEQIQRQLSGSSLHGLSFCVLADTTEPFWQAYTRLVKFRLTLLRKSDHARKVVRQLMNRLLVKNWVIENHEARILDALLGPTAIEHPRWEPMLPSMGASS